MTSVPPVLGFETPDDRTKEGVVFPRACKGVRSGGGGWKASPQLWPESHL